MGLTEKSSNKLLYLRRSSAFKLRVRYQKTIKKDLNSSIEIRGLTNDNAFS